MLIIIVTDYKAVLTSAFNFMAVDLPGNILFYCAQQLKQRQCDTSRPGTVTKESTVAEVPSHLEPVCEDGGRSHEVCTEPVTVEVPSGSLHTHSEPAWEDDGRCDEAVTEPAVAKVRRTSVRSHSGPNNHSKRKALHGRRGKVVTDETVGEICCGPQPRTVGGRSEKLVTDSAVAEIHAHSEPSSENSVRFDEVGTPVCEDDGRCDEVVRQPAVMEVHGTSEPICEGDGRSHELVTESAVAEVDDHSQSSCKDSVRSDEVGRQLAVVEVRSPSVRSRSKSSTLHGRRGKVVTDQTVGEVCCVSQPRTVVLRSEELVTEAAVAEIHGHSGSSYEESLRSNEVGTLPAVVEVYRPSVRNQLVHSQQ